MSFWLEWMLAVDEADAARRAAMEERIAREDEERRRRDSWEER